MVSGLLWGEATHCAKRGSEQRYAKTDLTRGTPTKHSTAERSSSYTCTVFDIPGVIKATRSSDRPKEIYKPLQWYVLYMSLCLWTQVLITFPNDASIAVHELLGTMNR